MNKLSPTQVAALRAVAVRGYAILEGGSETRRGKTRYYPSRLYTSVASFNRATARSLFRLGMLERAEVGGEITLTIAAHTALALA